MFLVEVLRLDNVLLARFGSRIFGKRCDKYEEC
jgi:hypothetical protein